MKAPREESLDSQTPGSFGLGNLVRVRYFFFCRVSSTDSYHGPYCKQGDAVQEKVKTTGRRQQTEDLGYLNDVCMGMERAIV